MGVDFAHYGQIGEIVKAKSKVGIATGELSPHATDILTCNGHNIFITVEGCQPFGVITQNRRCGHGFLSGQLPG